MTSILIPTQPSSSRPEQRTVFIVRCAVKSTPAFRLCCCSFFSARPLRAQQPAGQSIYALTQQFLAVAPKRFNGSPGHLAAETFIKEHFKPEAAKGNFETDQFTANTPAGPQTMRNFIVRFPGKKDGVIVLASHYETNYPLRDIAFVGANDGACTTALLIGAGRILPRAPTAGLLHLAALRRRRRGRPLLVRLRLALRHAPHRRALVLRRHRPPHQGRAGGRHDR